MLILVAAAVVVSLGVGVLAERRAGGRARRAARVVLTGMLYGLVPFVAFFNLARLDIDVDVGGGIVLGWLTFGLVGVAAYAGARALRLSRPATGGLIVAAMQANTGYLGVPLVAAAFGTDEVAQAVAFDMVVQLPTLLIAGFAIGAAFGTGSGAGARARMRAFLVRNPPLIAAVAGLLAPDALAPDVLVHVSQIMVIALLPLGFFAVGVTLASEAEEGVLRFPPRLTAPVGAAVVLRVGVAPALLWLLALPVIDIPWSFVVLAAMPTAINALVIGHAYGLDQRLIAGAITWSTGLVVVGALVATLVMAL